MTPPRVKAQGGGVPAGKRAHNNNIPKLRPAEMVPEVTKPLMDARFFGFGVCNGAIAALLYPVSTDKAVLKFQNLVFTLFMVAFLPVLGLFFNEGMMGVTGAGQYAVMTGLAAVTHHRGGGLAPCTGGGGALGLDSSTQKSSGSVFSSSSASSCITAVL